MLRAVASVIAGYATMAVTVMVTFMIACVALGVDRTLEPGSYEPSSLWVILSFALGLLGAVAGGWVCAAIARSATPPKVLIGLVVLLGLAMAAWTLLSTGEGAVPPARTADVGTLEAMQYAKTPGWVAVLNPIVGAVGIWIGAARLSKRRA